MLKVLPSCGHAYHTECIDQWLAGSKVRLSAGGQMLLNLSSACAQNQYPPHGVHALWARTALNHTPSSMLHVCVNRE